MGTMERIRQTSPLALAIFAVLFVGFMVLSDMNIGDVFNQSRDYNTAVIGKVNGEEILYRDYEARVKQIRDNQVAQSQDPEFQPDDKKIHRQVWNSITEELILKQEAAKIGVFVSNEEIADEMIERPPQQMAQMFTDSVGKFNRAAYLDLITNPESIREMLPESYSEEQKQEQIDQFRQQVMMMEDQIRRQKMFGLLISTVGSASTIITDEFARQQYVIDKSVADVNFIFYDLNNISDDEVSVSDDEIREYYESHKDLYEQKARRQVKYVAFPLKASENDTTRILKRIQIINEALNTVITGEQKDSVFNVKMSEFGGEDFDFTMINEIDPMTLNYLTSMEKGQIIGPVRVSDETAFIRLDDKRAGENEVIEASHILISFNENKDSAMTRAKEIMKEAKGGDFAALAIQYSQDRGSAQSGGSLGFFGKGRMVPEFEEAAFAANVGEIVGPVESQYGYHIIKVTDKKSEEYKYSKIALKPVMTNSTKKLIRQQAYAFVRSAQQGANFDTLAAQNGLRQPSSQWVVQSIGQAQPLFDNQYVTDKAFAANVGDVLDPVEVENMNAIVVVMVENARNAGITPLDNAKDQIRRELLKGKKLDVLKSAVEADFAKVKGLGNLMGAGDILGGAQVRTAAGLKNDGKVSGLQDDIAFTTEVFIKPANTIAEPIRGLNGYYIMQITSRTMPTQEEIEAGFMEFKKTLLQRSQQTSIGQWYQDVLKNADIEDNRVEWLMVY